MNAQDGTILKNRSRGFLASRYRRARLMPWVEIGTSAAAVTILIASYFVVFGGSGDGLLSPVIVALLLIGNLVPGVVLLVLVGRRVAKARAARSGIAGGDLLHVRLVAIFSVIAAVPTLLVVIFASLLFQYGVEFWFSDRARGMLENAGQIAEQIYQGEVSRVSMETVTMAGDLDRDLAEISIQDSRFPAYFGQQVLLRSLSEAVILNVSPQSGVQALALVNPYDRPLDKIITGDVLERLQKNPSSRSVPVTGEDRIGAVTRLNIGPNTYLYASRVFDPEMTANLNRGAAVLADYQALLDRSRALQLQFNAALLIISLLIVAAAVVIALRVADRLVRPIGDLVDAAQRIAEGDLSARVETPVRQDEVGRLARAFNRMTGKLEEQTGALANRSAFIEAVLSGVSAGVLSVDGEGRVQLMNSSAAALLGVEMQAVTGDKLTDLAPELAALLDSGDRSAVVQLNVRGDARTLAVKLVGDDGGRVLTFDDITQQLLDQRRAAWSDVARRIAHEIKNPLTPIQLAAERLMRRYSRQITDDPSTFERLTDTIVRQVADLRRMVDEFSSFARMPKPVFRRESLTDIARQTLFLHEVAHPEVRFALEQEDEVQYLVCDRRQIGQALTNLVKNAVEAIGQAKGERGEPIDGRVTLSIRHDEGGRRLIVAVADNGIGLPEGRERLVEPYVTTRSRGTGLGLAIVKKIIEEHLGTMQFADNPGGGTIISIMLDPEMLEGLEAGDIVSDADDERTPPPLTRKEKS